MRAASAAARVEAAGAANSRLVGSAGPENSVGLLAGGKENSMENDAQFALRLPAEVIARLDALGARLRSQRPGLRLSRADVTRMLILDALGRMEHALAGQDDAPHSAAGDAIKSPASAELFDHKTDSATGATAVDTARARYAPKRATS